MVASPTGGDFVALYQYVDISKHRECANIKFDLSFKYFYRSYESHFDLFHFFSVDIRNVFTPWISLHNSYVTRYFAPRTTDDHWLEHHDSFFYSNAINSFPLDTIIVSFVQASLPFHRLRVGVDDVRLTASCSN